MNTNSGRSKLTSEEKSILTDEEIRRIEQLQNERAKALLDKPVNDNRKLTLEEVTNSLRTRKAAKGHSLSIPHLGTSYNFTMAAPAIKSGDILKRVEEIRHEEKLKRERVTREFVSMLRAMIVQVEKYGIIPDPWISVTGDPIEIAPGKYEQGPERHVVLHYTLDNYGVTDTLDCHPLEEPEEKD